MLANIMGADGIIVIIAVVLVLLFGGSKLPKLARGLGSASHEFKKGIEEGNRENGAASTSDTTKSEAIPKDSSSST
jgi:sec-independent protein translocase protein TatA